MKILILNIWSKCWWNLITIVNVDRMRMRRSRDCGGVSSWSESWGAWTRSSLPFTSWPHQTCPNRCTWRTSSRGSYCMENSSYKTLSSQNLIQSTKLIPKQRVSEIKPEYKNQDLQVFNVQDNFLVLDMLFFLYFADGFHGSLKAKRARAAQVKHKSTINLFNKISDMIEKLAELVDIQELTDTTILQVKNPQIA